MKPTKQGQICKLINPISTDDPNETYLLLEDVDEDSEDTLIQIVSISELQRNISNPLLTPRKAVAKSELTVVADDLTSFVESWNK